MSPPLPADWRSFRETPTSSFHRVGVRRMDLRDHHHSGFGRATDQRIQPRAGGAGGQLLVAMESAAFVDLHLHPVPGIANVEGSGSDDDYREADRRIR